MRTLSVSLTVAVGGTRDALGVGLGRTDVASTDCGRETRSRGEKVRRIAVVVERMRTKKE